MDLARSDGGVGDPRKGPALGLENLVGSGGWGKTPGGRLKRATWRHLCPTVVWGGAAQMGREPQDLGAVGVQAALS